MNQTLEKFRFGPFELQTQSGELTRSGVPVKLAAQPTRVLALLVQRQGALVTRDEIRARVWSGTTVEFDLGLNYCIRQIRLALEDDAKDPQFIETVPKRGYRMLAPVVSTATIPVASAPAPVGKRWRAVGMTGILLVVVLGLWRFSASANSRVVLADPVLAKLYTDAERLATTWSEANTKKAEADFREVVQRQPEFAPAYASLANALVIQRFMGGGVDLLAEAEVMASKAIALDASSAAGHAALAHCLWQRWMWNQASSEFQRALALNPDSAISHQLYALFLASKGDADNAIRHAQQAVELAPSMALVHYSLAMVNLQTGHYAEAIAESRRTLEIRPDFQLAFHLLFRAYAMAKMLPEAGRVLDEWQHSSPDSVWVPWKVYWLARSGRMTEARALWTQGMAVAGSGNRASLAAGVALAYLGDVDAAFDSLDKSVGKHVGSVIWLKMTPELRDLRSDLRYAVLLSRLGLPQSH